MKKTWVSVSLIFILCVSAVHSSAQTIPQNILSKIHYRELGPTRQGGRVVAFAVSRQDSHVYFVGAGPGGLWKTVNNGTTFESVFDTENTLIIGDAAAAPSDHT